jgi:hypothetical protein
MNCKLIGRVRTDSSNSRVLIESSGNHNDIASAFVGRGIHPIVAKRVDELLELGIKPMKIRVTLVGELVPIEIIPTIKEIGDRGTCFRNNLTVPIRYEREFKDFVFSKLINEQKLFDTILPAEFLILEPIYDKTSGALFGYTFTSKQCVENLKNAINTNNGRMSLFNDGTYRLDCNGWTLIICGTSVLTLNSSTGEWRQSFRPFMFAFCRSEKKECFEKLYSSLWLLMSWLKIPPSMLKIVLNMMDASAAAAAGSISGLKNHPLELQLNVPDENSDIAPHEQTSSLPETSDLVNAMCYFHVAHGFRDHKTLLGPDKGDSKWRSVLDCIHRVI